jgi:hypothetical protein
MTMGTSTGLWASVKNDLLHDHQTLILKASIGTKLAAMALDQLAAKIAKGLK